MPWIIVIVVVILLLVKYNPAIDFWDKDYIFIWYGSKSKRNHIKFKK